MNYLMIGMNCMHVHRSVCVFSVSGNFPKIAWRAVHSRQAVHVF